MLSEYPSENYVFWTLFLVVADNKEGGIVFVCHLLYLATVLKWMQLMRLSQEELALIFSASDEIDIPNKILHLVAHLISPNHDALLGVLRNLWLLLLEHLLTLVRHWLLSDTDGGSLDSKVGGGHDL